MVRLEFTLALSYACFMPAAALQVDSGQLTICDFLSQRKLHLQGMWKAECPCHHGPWGVQEDQSLCIDSFQVIFPMIVTCDQRCLRSQWSFVVCKM